MNNKKITARMTLEDGTELSFTTDEFNEYMRNHPSYMEDGRKVISQLVPDDVIPDSL